MAENYTPKRQALAVEAMQAADQIAEGLAKLADIRQLITQSGGGWDDADFGVTSMGQSIVHVNAWKMNNLINEVGPGLSAAMDTTLPASAVTYGEILAAVRP